MVSWYHGTMSNENDNANAIKMVRHIDLYSYPDGFLIEEACHPEAHLSLEHGFAVLRFQTMT